MEVEILYAIVASVIWGGMFAVSKNVKTNQIFQNVYITAGGFATALIVSVMMRPILTTETLLAGLASGVLWACASLSFLYAMKYIGIGRALPMSVSGQILVSFLWGALLFGEIIYSGMLNILMALAAIFLICASAFIVSRTKENVNAKNFKTGILAAFLSSLFWGTQFVPVKLVAADAVAVMAPLAAGMLLTASITAFVKFGKRINLSYSGKERNVLNGLLWAVGNYLALFAIAAIGMARGYVLTQIGAIIIPPLLGVFYFREIRERRNYLLLFLATIIIMAGTVLMTFAK